MSSPDSHTFTPDNWHEPYWIQVDAAQDDDSFDGYRQINHSMSTQDPFYSQHHPRRTTAHEMDDDPNAGRESGSETISGVNNGITATLEYAPLRHDYDPFLIRVDFSALVTNGYNEMRDHSLSVSNGEALRAYRTRGPGRSDNWTFEIAAAADSPLTVTLEGNRPCNEQGAVCASNGRRLANTLTLTLQGRVGRASRPDETVSEGEGQDLPEDSTTTGFVQLGQPATGVITAGDSDWFGLGLEQDKVYSITVKPAGDNPLNQARAELLDSTGAALPIPAYATTAAGKPPRILYASDSAGDYQLCVSGLAGTDVEYQILVAEAELPPGVPVVSDTNNGAVELAPNQWAQSELDRNFDTDVSRFRFPPVAPIKWTRSGATGSPAAATSPAHSAIPR